MDYWEFLIQQEGDQTWLPLENQQVEILEGRYRVAVHTSLANTRVDIRVSQLILTEMPPRRRVRKRKGRTNDAGLLVIFPYMQLSPGRWDIHCSGADVLDDFMGSGWERVVQLEVVPYEEDAWDPNWNPNRREADADPATVNADIESGPMGYRPEDGSPEARTTGPGVSEARGSAVEILDRATAEPNSKKDLSAQGFLSETGTLPLAIEVAADSTYGLQLDRQALVAQPGRTVFLEGEIFSLAGEALPDSELSIQLRDPQTARVLMETRQHLAAQSLPAKLSVDLKLQTNLKTRVVLGAVAIRAKVSRGAALASASFTITAGLHDLLDAIANQASALFEEEISVYPGSTEPFTPAQPAPETLIAPELPLMPGPNRTVPAAGLTLPPQLYPSDPPSHATGSSSVDEGGAERSPELPKLPQRPTPSFEDAATEPWDLPLPTEGESSGDETPEVEVPEVEAPLLQEVGEAAEFAALYQQANSSEDAAPLPPSEGSPAQFDSTLEDEDLDAELAAAVLTDEDDFDDEEDAGQGAELSGLEPEESFEVGLVDDDDDSPTAYVEQSFQSLNLKARFWDRLTALTYDGHETAAKLRSEMTAAGVTPSPSVSPLSKTKTMPRAAKKPPTSLPPAPVATDEVVVYDDPPAVLPLDVPEPEERPEPITITPPKIDVPEQDLVAGELVSIRLRLTAGQYRPYAKVWMNDRQTRKLIEDPRLVMHFTPNSFGELETLMRIKVPLGCMELQIAAIAIDMATLQESSRAMVNRHVVPPDLPVAGLDDL